jgi:hypothetical protein
MEGSTKLDAPLRFGGKVKQRAGPSRRTDARLWHPWLRINRLLRSTLHERWSAEASSR